MGVAEMTRFGMKEADSQEFAAMFTEAVRGRNVADEVACFRERFQTMNYCFDIDFSEYKNYLTGLF
jgi:glycine/serine hydroxymethyltransferase